MTTRITIPFNDSITSVTMNDGVFQLLAIKLKTNDENKMVSVREWIVSEIHTHERTEAKGLSQWITFQAVLFLADDETTTSYLNG